MLSQVDAHVNYEGHRYAAPAIACAELFFKARSFPYGRHTTYALFLRCCAYVFDAVGMGSCCREESYSSCLVEHHCRASLALETSSHYLVFGYGV